MLQGTEQDQNVQAHNPAARPVRCPVKSARGVTAHGLLPCCANKTRHKRAEVDASSLLP